MAYTEFFSEGVTGSFASTETTNTIAQNTFVCFDVTNKFGVVRTDNANAGAVMGINSSTGTVAPGVATSMASSAGNSGVGVAVQPGQAMRITVEGIAPCATASSVTIAVGDKLYTNATLQGAVTNVATSNKFVGYAIEPSTGNGEIIAVKIATLCGV